MKRRYVSFEYTLKNAEGETLDTSVGAEPMCYVEGAQQIIPGLEKRLKDLKAGDKSKITVPAAEAYGAREERLVIQVPLTEFPDGQKVHEGLQFEVEIADGMYHPFTVTSLNKTHATLDGNHALAGIDLYFDVELKEAREATTREIEEAEEESEPHHEHGPDCRHSH